MTKEEFNEIKKLATNKRIPSELGKHNINVFRYRVDGDETEFRTMYQDLNYKGNEFKTDEEAKKFIIDLLEFDCFNDEQWNKLLPYINVFEFNKEYNKVYKQLKPILQKLRDRSLHQCLHLEFWQGALSFGGHWCNEECDFNYKNNGKMYERYILKIKELITPLIEKYNCHYTLMERISNDEPSNLTFTWN